MDASSIVDCNVYLAQFFIVFGFIYKIVAAEKDDILLFETHLAAATSGKTITEESSLLLRQLISLAPE